MIGYDEDGQSLLDQELIIAKADPNNPDVYRIGHHRSDENEFDYYGEPHVSISPSGTRVLFGSDWSGSEDGQSIDCYVVELPVFGALSAVDNNNNSMQYQLFQNPLTEKSKLTFNNPEHKPFSFYLYNIQGKLIQTIENIQSDNITIDQNDLTSGIYLFRLISNDYTLALNGKLIIR